jgi:hypothetical protein
MVREWPDKEFIAETLSMFPDEGVANAEQARVSKFVLLGSPGSAIGHEAACKPGFAGNSTAVTMTSAVTIARTGQLQIDHSAFRQQQSST